MTNADTVKRLESFLASRPEVQAAFLFGSMAQGSERPDSDLDLAVQMTKPMSVHEKMAMIEELAAIFGRAIDLIDLRQAGQPLLGEIINKGVMVKGTSSDRGDLLFKSIMDWEDFGPYQKRILEGRRKQWIGR